MCNQIRKPIPDLSSGYPEASIHAGLQAIISATDASRAPNILRMTPVPRLLSHLWCCLAHRCPLLEGPVVPGWAKGADGLQLSGRELVNQFIPPSPLPALGRSS